MQKAKFICWITETLKTPLAGREYPEEQKDMLRRNFIPGNMLPGKAMYIPLEQLCVHWGKRGAGI